MSFYLCMYISYMYVYIIFIYIYVSVYHGIDVFWMINRGVDMLHIEEERVSTEWSNARRR